MLIPLGLALLILIFIFAIYQRASYRNNMLRNLRILTEIIADNSTAALSFQNRSDAEEILTALKAERNITAACICTPEKKIFAAYRKNGAELNLPIVILDSDHVFKKDHLIVFRPIKLNQEIIGYIYIQASLIDLYSRLKNILIFACILFGLLYGGIYLFSLKLNRSILRPILHLANIAREVSIKSDYSVRARKFNNDELGLLTESFNMMLSHIQNSDRALQNTHNELKKRARELQRELTERMLAELQLKKSLREKNILLKEIHHRVKNNLQIISSLIYLQSRQVEDQQLQQLLQDSQNRVRSMALIHDKLFNSTDLSRINFREYIRGLVSHLFNSYHIVSSKIKLEIAVKIPTLSINTAIYCGMIINELVSNSLKHAFPENQYGLILIKIEPADAGKFVLVVKDNGIGLPDDFRLDNINSLGLQLVNNLTEQLNGETEFFNDNGAIFQLTFEQI